MIKQSRVARVRENMARMNLKQIVVSSIESVYYLTGLWVDPGERMTALLISETECRFFVNHMFALSGAAGDLPLTEFDDIDDPVSVLAQFIAPGALGIDKTWPSHFTIRLMKARPDVIMALGSAPVDDARMLKDEEELKNMRLSSLLNDEIVGSLPASLRLGEGENDVARRYIDRAVARGAAGQSFSPLVCFGANCAEPHHATDKTALQRGDAVILDLGLSLNHAMSDMTRTVFVGQATDEQKKVYDVVCAANAAGKAAVKPGVPLKDIDRAARKVIEDAGYGPYFLHRTGHGIGLAVHEPPDCSATSEIIARPGMVFSIEPGIYLSGRFGVRVEDLVAVTQDGCEVLNKLPRDLQIVDL